LITHNAAANRFEAEVPGGTAFLDYRIQGDRCYLLYVETPPAARGHGYAAAVTKAAIEWALEQNLKLVPICPFTDAYLRRHPEYQRE
jgi:predicted GNAT family acetyltransferase